MSSPTFNALQRKMDLEASAVDGLKAFSCEVLFRHAKHLYNEAIYLEHELKEDESWTRWCQVGAICKLINEKLETVNFLEKSTENLFREIYQEYEAKIKSAVTFEKQQFEEDGALAEQQSDEEDVYLSHIHTPKDNHYFRLEKMTTFDIFQAMDHYHTDAELVVDGKSIKVHRHILCMLSPVFQACFSHDTQEAKTGVIEIKDFDFFVVRMVVNYCYGRNVGDLPIADVISILRFADKYDIKSITTKIGHYPFVNLTINKFCVVAQYAWDLDKEDLKEECCRFYRRKLAELTLTRDFADLPTYVREDLLHGAIAFCHIYPEKEEDE